MNIINHEINKVGRDFVVGDIHGCFSLLESELEKVNFNKSTDRLFCTGDLVDRGPESHKVAYYLMQPWFFSILGNHEQLAIEYQFGVYDRYGYYQNGGQWFIEMDEDSAFAYCLKFRDLPIARTIETKNGKVGIVHAVVPYNDWKLFEDNLEKFAEDNDIFKGQLQALINTALWDRSKHSSGVKNIDVVYVGHNVVNEITQRQNVFYIDTGAVFCGKLSILLI